MENKLFVNFPFACFVIAKLNGFAAEKGIIPCGSSIMTKYNPLEIGDTGYVAYPENSYIDCECSSLEHTIRLSYCREHDPSESRVYIHLFLQKGKFIERLILGIKYIFGYTSKFGHHEETIITKDKAADIIKLLQRLNS
jgi:hypothetical protein